MKKLLLILCLGFIICACSQKESKPSVELESDNSSPTGMLANMAKSIEDATNAAANTGEAKPYYFSDSLKEALSNCTPFKEDVYAKNPDMKKEAGSMLSMFFGEVDTSSFKLFFDVKGKKDDKCQVLLNYDYSLPASQDFDCSFSDEDIKKLIVAMNDKSTEKTERTIKSGFVTTKMAAREYDAVFAELVGNSCQVVEKKLSQEDIEEMQQKMLAFSDKFKSSLKTCTPDTEVLKVMGMEMNKAKIKGKEKGKCHVVLQGFHILLNDNELSSISGFDELGKLVSDEKRATYSPSYKYQGTLFSLSECEQVSSYNKDRDFGEGNEELSLCDSVKITRGVNSSYKNNACNLSFVLKMTRNGKTEDHSLLCNLTAEQLAQHIKPYSNLLAQYGPKIEISENSFSSTGGRQTEEVSKADMNLFLKLYKSGICKKGN